MNRENLFWTVVILLSAFVIFGTSSEPKDTCAHLTGVDYDWCHMAEVRGR